VRRREHPTAHDAIADMIKTEIEAVISQLNEP
jgi:hypothetical protein